MSSQHLSIDLVACSFEFARYLMVAPSGKELLSQMIEQLLFSAGLWIRASKKVCEGRSQVLFFCGNSFSRKELSMDGCALTIDNVSHTCKN